MFEDDIDLSNAILIVDSHHGIYCPKCFIDDIRLDCLNWPDEISETRKREILNTIDNPDDEFYWDEWDWFTQSVTVTDPETNIEYWIYQNEDVWLVPIDNG